MSHETVCRVCAADNVKMYSIANTEVQAVYEKLTNISLHADSRPLTVCYVCHSQLRNTRKLLLKALKVEEILVPILSGEVQLSTLDRQAHKLTSTLSVSRTEHMSPGMPLCSTVIKEEPLEESVGGCKQQEPTWGDTLPKNYVKREEDGDDLGSDDTISSIHRQISSNCEASTSRSESTTSSLGGYSSYLNKLDSKTGSSLNIFNLSMLLSNVDFMASPTAIYKTKSESTPKYQHQQHDNWVNVQSDVKLPPPAPECHKNKPSHLQIEHIENEIVQLSQNDDTVVENNTLKEIIVFIKTEKIHEGYNQGMKNERHPCNNYNTCGANNKQENENQFALIDQLVSESVADNLSEEIPSTSSVNKHEPQSTDEEVNHLHESSVSVDNENNTLNGGVSSTSATGLHELARKRSLNEDKWCDNVNKGLKNSGQPYRGARSKKYYSAKSMGPPCSCKKKCGEKFPLEQRQQIYNKFYDMQSHELQWQYIARHVEANPIKRLTIDRHNNRTQTLVYFFPSEESNIQVCKVFFLNTLKVSEQVVYTSLEKIKRDESLKDLRGTHSTRPRKMSELTKESIIAHIKLFPTMESNYIGKQSKRLCLSEHLNISKMYRLYTDWFSDEDYIPGQKATKRQYETIFNTMFNYSFYKPKKDSCGTCALYEQADQVRKEALEKNYNKHLARKNMLRQIREEEKASVDKSNTTVAIFKLENVLSVPRSEVGIFYYKRKYPVYNFTIYNCLNKSGNCYVWHLSIANRGSVEIASCLAQFIKEEKRKGIKNLSFYSDGCAGQNKNRYIFALYMHALKLYDMENITHRFFEIGHSQNEGDSMHSCIERALKNKVLYTPDQTYGVILNAKVGGNQYSVREMEQKDFFNIKELTIGKNWAVDIQGREIKWNQIMEIKVSCSKPNTIQFKYNFEGEYSEMNTEIGRGKRLPEDSTEVSLKQAYHQPISVSKLLKEDLLSLCRTEAIPHHYHSFYNSLQTCENMTEQSSDSETDCNDD